jgi:putative peptidoglycan lipid II flippase
MNLLKTLATVSSMTLLSRILGFVRDFVIARTFGAGMLTDAFFVAFKLPNLLRRLFAEGAFSQAFVPILGEYRNRAAPTKPGCSWWIASPALFSRRPGGHRARHGRRASLLVYVSAPGFADDPEKFALTVSLTRITFPYILFMSLVALRRRAQHLEPLCRAGFHAGAAQRLLHCHGAVCRPHFEPPVMALAGRCFIGGAVQLAFQIPALKRIGMLPRFSLEAARRRACAASCADGAGRAGRIGGPGQPAAEYHLRLLPGHRQRLLAVLRRPPDGVSGRDARRALGTILLPSLSVHADNNHDDYSRLLDWGLRLTLLLAAPAALALAILAVPLITTLFFHGAFTANDVLMTRNALVAYSIGLLGLILVKVLAPGFYARQNVRTPVKIAIISLCTRRS